MAIEWSFPSNNFGTLNGIGEAGIETFKGAPYRSLAREICQNSLDARSSKSKPVRVVFSLSSIQSRDIPRFEVLREALSRCLQFWKEQGNDKTVAFFKEATTVASLSAIDLLRISDFNTTGLTGSDKEYSTPWQDLVKASGVSSKGGSSGGSFGIGKSAPFACSKLRTVFYATKDINRLEAFQGIARLVSFREKGIFKDRDAVTTGIGYYGETKKNSAIHKCMSLEKGFQRQEPGTDVYVLGFMKSANWKREMVKAILEDFLIAIYQRSLEVVVEDTQITADTLPTIIEEYKDEAKSAYNYYLVLTSPEAEVITEDFNGLGKIELRVLIQPDLHRRVMMTRINGMKIFDQKNISASIQFAGICLLSDDHINGYFREMENPQHDAWEPERHSKPAEAKKNKVALARHIKEVIIERGRNVTVDEVDAEGVGEFLPDAPDAGTQRQGAAEGIQDTTKEVDIQVVSPGAWQKGFEYAATGQGTDTEDTTGEADETDFGGEGGKDFGDENENATHGGGGIGSSDGNGAGTHGEGENAFASGDDTDGGAEEVAKKKQVQMMAVRLIRTNPKINEYRLTFMPKKTYGKGYLQIKLSGEQKSSDDLMISRASLHTSGDQLRTKGNKILLDHIDGGQKCLVDFEITNAEACSMEVSLYGYPV